MNQSSVKKTGPIRRFFSTLWSVVTWTRIAFLNIIFILFIVLLFSVFKPSSVMPLPHSFALKVAPTGILVDQLTYIDPASLLFKDDDSVNAETQLRDIVDAIYFAANDDRVSAIVLETDKLFGGGISKMQEIGEALTHFKTTGKPVIAFGDNFTQDQYYLASYADQIYMNDMGNIMLTGYGRYGNYFKEALDKLDINFHVFRSGKFKDAIEPLLRNDMSEESREHNLTLVNQLWEVYTRDVEAHRGLDRGALTSYINGMDSALKAVNGDASALAIESGLIDTLASQTEIQTRLINEFGANNEGDNYQGVDSKRYLTEMRMHQLPHADQVGLLYASGNIIDGKQPDGAIGSETLSTLLREAANNPAIKALVLRIDSGGGSAFASEIIRTEIAAVRTAGKPVVISMGSVAASGGYWIATESDEIFATPSTITGSIGVFGAFPTFEKTLSNLGVHTDGVGTTELAGSLRLDRPLSPQAGSIIQQGVDNIYQRFVELVATARKATPEDIHEVAQGHVWSGLEARELGLVDQIGSLNAALASAAERAQLDKFSITVISQPLSPQEMFLRELMSTQIGALSSLAPHSVLTQLIAQAGLTPLLNPLSLLKSFNDPRSIYTACLECIAP